VWVYFDSQSALEVVGENFGFEGADIRSILGLGGQVAFFDAIAIDYC